jgi:hypothetical protein
MRSRILLWATASLALAGCHGLYGHDEGQRYIQRSDTITLSAGDAPNLNARTHMVDPWPPGVSDRRIPAEGSRMVRAVDRYKRGPAHVQGTTSGGGARAAGAAGEPPPGQAAKP